MTEASNSPRCPDWVEPLTQARAIERMLEGTLRPPQGRSSDTLVELFQWLDWQDRERSAALLEDVHSFATARWGTWRPEGPHDAVEISEAWIALATLAALNGGAGELRDFLRGAVSTDGGYLRSLSASREHDAFGAALGAATVGQHDRSLASFWWGFADLTRGEGVRYMLHGVTGLLAMPGQGGATGLFDGQLGASALSAAARATAREIDEGVVTPTDGHRALADMTKVVRLRYPRWDWWAPHFADVDLDPEYRALLQAGFPELATTQRAQARSSRRVASAPPRQTRDRSEEWRQRATELRESLHEDPVGQLPRAERLLDEQRSHAETYGEAHPLVQTLCNLSTPLRSRQPDTARRWAEEALTWEPWNPYPWSALVTALEVQKDRVGAIEQGFRAIERVPYNDRLWFDLSNALRRTGCLEQAVEVGWSALQRFGSALGLKAVMIACRSAGRPDLALQAAKEEWNDDDPVITRDIWLHWVGAYLDQGETQAAKHAWDLAEREGFQLKPFEKMSPYEPFDRRRLFAPTDDEVACRAQSRFLRLAVARGQWDRAACLQAAETMVESATKFASSRGESDRAVAEHALLKASTGEITKASELVDAGLLRSPGNPALWQMSGALGVERARMGTREFDEAALRELRAPYDRSVALRATTLPVAQLGYARAALSLFDGQAADDASERACAVIRTWHRSAPARSSVDAAPTPAEVSALWKTAAAHALLGPDADTSVASIRHRSAADATLLTDLESTFDLQYAA